MSYDLRLVNAQTGENLELPEKHHHPQGTYRFGGEPFARINITYNYSTHFHRVLKAPGGEGQGKGGTREGSGIRSIYGLTGKESQKYLRKAIRSLGNDVSNDYWEATEGNAKRALKGCLALAEACPDGVWEGD